MEPAGARLAGRRPRARRERTTVRAASDPVAEMYEDSDFDVVDVVREVAASAACLRHRSRWPGCSTSRR